MALFDGLGLTGNPEITGNISAGLAAGGALTGGSLGLAGQQPQPQQPVAPAPPPIPQAGPPPTPQAAPKPPPQSLLTKPFDQFSTGDKLKFALASGLMAMGGQSAMAARQQAMQRRGAAMAAHEEEVNDLMIRGLNAVKDIEDPEMRDRAGEAIAKRLAEVGGASASESFTDIFTEPAVQNVLFSPETIQEFGTIKRAIAAKQADPKEFRQRAIAANIGSLERELLRLRETSPDTVKMDANKNGVITASEARNWVRKRMDKKDTNLTPAQMNIVEMPEFEPFLADMFDARTSAATTKAQEKDLRRAINRQGKLVFATEEELRRDRSLVPEPKKPLVQFGSEKREQALFESLIKRRDTLREQAQGGQQTIGLAHTMRDTAIQIQTGRGTETLSDIKSLGATIARLAGADNLAAKIADTDVENAEVLRSLNSQAVQAFIASGPRQGSISNEDRRKYEKVAPGLATTQGGNIALSHIMEAMGTSKTEESAFIDRITEQVARGERDSDIGSQAAFQAYVTDLPYTKGDGVDIRFVGSDTNLWRFYLNGRPKQWLFSGGELTIDEIKQIAKDQGLTARELLLRADKKGTIQGVR